MSKRVWCYFPDCGLFAAQQFAGGDVALIEIQAARQNAKQGGLSGAVGADEADALAVGDAEGNVFKKRFRAEGFTD